MGATPDEEIRPRTPLDERLKAFMASEKAAGRAPAGASGGANPGLFEPSYGRRTQLTGSPQVMGVTPDDEIRPRTPPQVRLARNTADQAAAAGGNGGTGVAGRPGNNGGGGREDGNGQGGPGNQPETPERSIFYPIQPMQPRPTTQPRVMGDGLGPVRPRTPIQDRQRLWREEQAREAAAAGGTGNDGTDDSNAPPAETPFEPRQPEQPRPDTEPQILGVTATAAVRPRTPPGERDERRRQDTEAARAAAEAAAAQRAVDAEAATTPENPPDEPTGGAGGNGKNSEKPEDKFSTLFAPPAPRRHLGPDGRIPAHIANAPVMGRDPPPPRESRLQRKRRVAAEKAAMIQQLRDAGEDVDAILAQTEGVPDLTAFPLVSAPFAKRDCELMMCRRQMNKTLLKSMPRTRRTRRKNAFSWAWPRSLLRMMHR